MKQFRIQKFRSVVIRNYNNFGFRSAYLDIIKLKKIIQDNAKNTSKFTPFFLKYMRYVAFSIIGLASGITLATVIILSNVEYPLSSVFPSSASFLTSSYCASIANESNHANTNNGVNGIPFTRNFVADAADVVSPAVVNIMTQIEGFMVVGASAGSGFIISKDGIQQTI